jgi:hypothetical protein
MPHPCASAAKRYHSDVQKGPGVRGDMIVAQEKSTASNRSPRSRASKPAASASHRRVPTRRRGQANPCKALALEFYARQALNRDAEVAAGEMRLRAEVRAGELLADMAKAKGAANGEPGPGRGNKTRSHDATAFSTPGVESGESTESIGDTLESEPPSRLADMGITKTQSSRWQQLATIPEPEFEAVLADRMVPLTTARVLTKAPGY